MNTEQNQKIYSKKKPDFKPIDEKDKIIIKALSLKQIINKNNLVEENVGGERELQLPHVKKIIKEPANKSLERRRTLNLKFNVAKKQDSIYNIIEWYSLNATLK